MFVSKWTRVRQFDFKGVLLGMEGFCFLQALNSLKSVKMYYMYYLSFWCLCILSSIFFSWITFFCLQNLSQGAGYGFLNRVTQKNPTNNLQHQLVLTYDLIQIKTRSSLWQLLTCVSWYHWYQPSDIPVFLRYYLCITSW